MLGYILKLKKAQEQDDFGNKMKYHFHITTVHKYRFFVFCGSGIKHYHRLWQQLSCQKHGIDQSRVLYAKYCAVMSPAFLGLQHL